MNHSKNTKSKRECIFEILKSDPDAKSNEIVEQLKELGFDKCGSSEISDVRRKLGLGKGQSRPSAKNSEITLVEVESICELPEKLGTSTKEAFEICQLIAEYSETIGGIARLTEALRVLNKFTSIG